MVVIDKEKRILKSRNVIYCEICSKHLENYATVYRCLESKQTYCRKCHKKGPWKCLQSRTWTEHEHLSLELVYE